MNNVDLDALRQQVDALKQSITALEQANLHDDADALRARVASLQAQIQTQGGAVIAGDVKTAGGDFVGRDQVNITLDPEKASREELLSAYYRRLADECGQLPLGTVDPEFARPARQVSLHQVYVGLDVVAPVRAVDEDKRAWGLRLARGEGDGRVPLLDALAEPEAARVVLLGDPGSGKSTFVNYLTYRLADAAAGNAAPDDLPADVQGLWPARLILREVARFLPPDACGTADLLWQALRADLTQRLGEVAAERLLPHLQARLLRRGWFLLDGLDEVPTAHRRRECLLEAIQALLSQQVGGRMLLTARPYAYADDAWQLPGLPILALAPFDEAQVNRFVKGWYEAVRPVMGWSPVEATARGEQLSTALQARPRLGDLASRPLLLTLMATLHTSWGQLPEDRADLYEESVKLLLARWQRARTVRTPEGEELQPGITAKLDTELQPLRRALERLAYDAHGQQAQAPERDDTPADISEGDVLVALCDVLPENVNARNVLPYLKHRAGLLLERRPGVYAFPHRSFQEYLAACYLAETEEDFGGRLRELVWDDPTWWREVFLLGVGKAKQGGLSNAVAVVNALVPDERVDVANPTSTHWRAASLAGEALLDLNLPHQARGRPHHQALLRRVRRWLTKLIEKGHLSAQERATAGDILGQLGDPRFDPDLYYLPRKYQDKPEPSYGFVKIAAGSFPMGKGNEEHQVDIPYDYWIARYPVTVAQFGLFIDDGGYEDPKWWTRAGWGWRLGELDNQVEEKRFKRWLERRPVENRTLPMWWEKQKQYLTRPVMGLSWFEAVAYAEWLQKRVLSDSIKIKVFTGEDVQDVDLQNGILNVRIPSEAEWEKATFYSKKQRYPWGNEDWDVERANVEKQISHPSPVGMYPKGTNAWSVHELAGNVWEWTRTAYSPYPYIDDKVKATSSIARDRVLRGGSWGSGRHDAHCTYRLRILPIGFSSDFGFRVIISLIASED